MHWLILFLPDGSIRQEQIANFRIRNGCVSFTTEQGAIEIFAPSGYVRAVVSKRMERVDIDNLQTRGKP